MSAVAEIKPIKKRYRGPERITTRIAVETWGRRALLDLYLALGDVEMISVVAHLHLLAQGVEKLGKAYLIAAQAARFEHLSAEEAIRWIDQYARRHNHRLSDILGSAGIGVPSLRDWLRDPVIEILERAMEEGRYPVLLNRSLGNEVEDSELRDKALAIASALVHGIRTAFEVDLVNTDRPPYGGIADDGWTRFLSCWKAAAKRHHAASPVRVDK